MSKSYRDTIMVVLEGLFISLKRFQHDKDDIAIHLCTRLRAQITILFTIVEAQENIMVDAATYSNEDLLQRFEKMKELFDV